MQTKTNDDPLKKMSKSTMWDLGIAGASALGAAFGIPPSLTSAAGGALKGQLYDEKNEAGYVDPNLIANQQAQYQDNLSNLSKKGPIKELSPITSYYGEAKNLSSLAYKDSILMKTISGVSTLKKEHGDGNGNGNGNGKTNKEESKIELFNLTEEGDKERERLRNIRQDPKNQNIISQIDSLRGVRDNLPAAQLFGPEEQKLNDQIRALNQQLKNQ